MAAGPAPDEALLGTADLQSLADLGNRRIPSWRMRPVPFGLKDVTRLAIIGGIAVPALDADNLFAGTVGGLPDQDSFLTDSHLIQTTPAK